MPMKLKVFLALILLAVGVIAAYPAGAGTSALVKISATVLPPPPIAAFTVTTSCGSLVVSFTDKSTGATSYSWNFGDGTALSTVENPSHTYSSPGTYSVIFTVTASGGSSSSITKKVTVPPPCAAFTFSTTCGTNSVAFSDTSTGSGPFTYLWNFGDPLSTTSTSQNPSFTYTSAGTYSVTLTITALDGTTSKATNSVTVPPPSGAGFTVTRTCGSNSVTFTSTSCGAASYSWNFGDKSTSTSATVTHKYSCAGTYTVTLTIKTSGGTTYTTTKLVTVPPPCASFKVSTSCGSLTAAFTDTSTGGIKAWSWNFGDGGTSTTQSPSHTYGSAGSHTVTLTITANDGSTSTTTQTVKVPPLCAAFSVSSATCGGNSLTRTFTDQSSPSSTIKSWLWTFGDSSSLTINNPPASTGTTTHSYAKAGSYSVGLQVTAQDATTASTSQSVTVCAPLTASFTSTTSGKKVTFKDTSSGTPTSWSWNFGDSSTSTSQNPSHSYSCSTTSYPVTLTVKDACGCSSSVTQSVKG